VRVLKQEDRLPNIASSKRQIRTDARRTLRNKNVRSHVKTGISRAERLIAAGKLEEAQAAVKTAVAQLDKASAKGVLHPNNTSRRKSRLVAKLNKANAAKAQSA
jgi:small subunit ribosomal protein S20